MSPPKTPSFDQDPATQSTVVSHQKKWCETCTTTLILLISDSFGNIWGGGCNVHFYIFNTTTSIKYYGKSAYYSRHPQMVPKLTDFSRNVVVCRVVVHVSDHFVDGKLQLTE